MPTGNLPAEGKKLFEKVYQDYLHGACKGDESCAAKRAWGAVHQAGWKKDKDGNWHKKSEALVEMSMIITKAALDPETGEMRWSATASDTDEDTYQETMSLRLFNAFIKNAQAHVKPPDEHCTDFWCGGMPYMSVAHYRDQNGLGVPGETRKLYTDGNRLKASGIFYDTPLGRSAFKSVRDSKNDPNAEKVRISIGFLDFEHAHGDTVFRRKSVTDICPLCLAGVNSKQYLDGILIHLALTRVPVNKRTIIQAEVDKSMADEIRTRKDDAASIVGDELAEELEKRAATSVMKSEAELVIKSDSEETVETEAEPKVIEESVTAEVAVEKMEDVVMALPFGGAATWEEYDSWVSQQEASRAIYDAWYTMEALAQNALQRPDVEDKKKSFTQLLSGCKKRMELKSMIILSKLEEFDPSKLVVERSAPVETHPLDEIVRELKNALDEISKSTAPIIEKLQAIQPVYAKLGESVKQIVEQSEVKQAQPEVASATPDPLTETLRDLKDQVAMLTSQISAMKSVSVIQASQPPHRNASANVQVMRSIQSLTAPDRPRKIKDVVRESVFGAHY